MDFTRESLYHLTAIIPGLLLLGSALGHLYIDDEILFVDFTEIALPILIAFILIGVGYRYSGDSFHQRERNMLAIGSLAGGGVFAAITGWILYVVSLEGGLPDEVFPILINGAAPGMLLSVLLIGVYLRLDRQSTQMELLNNQLQVKNEQLDEFAAIVSHDLRNPLNVAKGRMELASDTGDLEQLKTAMRSLDRMETIISDVLTLSRHGEEIGELEQVDLEDVTQAAWDSVDVDDIELKIVNSSQFGADRSRLRQALENLFRNAADHGGDSISEIRVGPIASNGFYVEDNGVGIHPENRDEVFEAGYSTGPKGTGLGLNIVAAVVEAHGWEIDVSESDSGGARFEVKTGSLG